jgi:S1-C subfamily serine protease
VVRVEGRRGSGGSGVAWSDAVVLTASHVVEWDEGIEIGLADGRTLPATLAGRDPATDIAALRVETSALPPVAWAEDAALKVGQLVLGISRPGQSARARLGVVNALADSWRSPTARGSSATSRATSRCTPVSPAACSSTSTAARSA